MKTNSKGNRLNSHTLPSLCSLLPVHHLSLPSVFPLQPLSLIDRRESVQHVVLKSFMSDIERNYWKDLGPWPFLLCFVGQRDLRLPLTCKGKDSFIRLSTLLWCSLCKWHVLDVIVLELFTWAFIQLADMTLLNCTI